MLRPRKEWEYEQAHKPVTSSRVVDSQDDEAVTSPPTKVTVSSIAEAIPTAAAKGCDLTGQLVSESADKGATHIPKGPACTGPGSSGPAAHKVVDEEASVIRIAAPGSSCVKKLGRKATVRWVHHGLKTSSGRVSTSAEPVGTVQNRKRPSVRFVCMYDLGAGPTLQRNCLISEHLILNCSANFDTIFRLQHILTDVCLHNHLVQSLMRSTGLMCDS